MPVRNKPTLTDYDFSREVIEIPNMIDRNLATSLKEFALDAKRSGLHRRGSKNINCTASFYTCLVFEHNDPIYEFLDEYWQQYVSIKKPILSFIEPYEIKSYIKNDRFDVHNDIQVSEIEGYMRISNLIIQLSDPSEYEGGDLLVGNYKCSKEFGTGIFFPAAINHLVTEITEGTRFSLIGHAWGPI